MQETTTVVAGDGDVKLAVRAFAEPASGAPGLLLHHGLASSTHIWDLMLPRLSGERVCQELRGDPRIRSIPVVVVSARIGEAERLRALAAGADAFVCKPYGAPELLAEIRTRLKIGRRAAA